jgi:hypothetical protein
VPPGWRFTARRAFRPRSSRRSRTKREGSEFDSSSGARADFFVYQGDFAAGDFDATKVRTVVKGGVVHVSDGAWVSAVPE